jgi:uncharacterized membrane protein YvlD (DUF360 family)
VQVRRAPWRARDPLARIPIARPVVYARRVIALLVRAAIALAGSAIGLIVASLLLDGVEINVTSFLVAVVIFTAIVAILQPFLALQLRRFAPQAVGGVALVATLVALIVTDLVSDGFSISGIGDWIAATFVVWLVSLLAVFILPFLGLRRFLETRRA